MRKPFAILFAAGLVLNSLSAAAAEEMPFGGVVSANQVNVRSGANRNFEIALQLNEGDLVFVVGKDYEWYKIQSPPEAFFFIHENFVKKESEKFGIVTGDGVNLRVKPDSNSNIVGQLERGRVVKILAQTDSWYKIQSPPGDVYLWIHSDFIKYGMNGAEYLKIAKARQEVSSRFEEAEERITAELAKPPLEAEPEGPLADYRNLCEANPHHPYTKRAQERLGEWEAKLAEIKHLKAAALLAQRETEYQKKLEELTHPSRPTTPPTAAGWIEDLGMFIRRPGTHKLVKEGKILYYLKSTACNLDYYQYCPVKIWGQVSRPAGWPRPLIDVEEIEATLE